MDVFTLRKAFATFLGPDHYHQFVDRLSMDERLDCWQERSWLEFVAAHPEFSCKAGELPGFLNASERPGRTPQPVGLTGSAGAGMTEERWLGSEDVPAMLSWFRANWHGTESDLNRLIQRYCLACCRPIWPLLIYEASRRGVEVAELYNEGLATREEFAHAEREAEGAAFHFEQNADAEHISRCAARVASIPPEELRQMVRPRGSGEPLPPIEILASAAYFADFAMCYTGIRSKDSIDRYESFLSAPLLRKFVGHPFRTE